MNTKITTTTTKETIIKLTGDDIVDLLRHHPRFVSSFPDTALGINVTFRVPTGADWSGEVLDITNDDPITVIITQTAIMLPSI